MEFGYGGNKIERVNKASKGFEREIHMKTFVSESLCGPSIWNFIKKRLQRWCFSVNTAKFFQNTYFEGHLPATASYFMKKNRHSWRLRSWSNLWIFSFVKWRVTKKSLKKVYANLIKYQAENCPVLPVWNLIFTCNRRVKSVSAWQVEISSRQAGIMLSPSKCIAFLRNQR